MNKTVVVRLLMKKPTLNTVKYENEGDLATSDDGWMILQFNRATYAALGSPVVIKVTLESDDE